MVYKDLNQVVPFLLSVSLVCLGFFLPYSIGPTTSRINESSVEFQFAEGYYLSTLYGFEGVIAWLNLVLVGLIALIFFFTKKRGFKFLLIPLGAIFLFSQLLVFITTLSGFGAPVGNSLKIGFYLMFVGSISTIILAATKPHRNSPKVFDEFL